MSHPFKILSASASGIGAYSLELAAVADNIANMNNVTTVDSDAYAERFVVVRPETAGTTPGELGTGVEVTRAEFGSDEGRIAYDPSHPDANAEGLVRVADVNLPANFQRMIVAQRGLQANVSVFARAREMYQSILSLGGQ
jgi:flagellar basal-body rod protein FlgC